MRPRVCRAVPAVLLALGAFTAGSLSSTASAEAARLPARGISGVTSSAFSGNAPSALTAFTAASAAASVRRLSWAPPALTAPTTIQVGNSAATLALRSGRDYVLRLPVGRAAVRPAGLVVSGGRNVVLIGGSVDVAGGVRTANGQLQRRALYLKGQTGTVFLEGVSFFSSTTGSLTEGINLDQRYGATVVLQNIRLARLVGSRNGQHADGLQTWAGPRRLLVDGLFIQTQYQGMFLLPNQQFKSGPRPVLFDLRNISIVGESGSGYLLWRDRQAFPWRLTNVYVRPGSHKLTSRGRFLWDPVGTFAPVRAVNSVPPVALGAGAVYRTPGYSGRA